MGEWKPLIYSVSILLIIGVIIPNVLIGFGFQETLAEPTGLISTIINVVDTNLIPEAIRTYLIDYFLALSLIPMIILTPLLILCILGITYTIIKTLPLT